MRQVEHDTWVAWTRLIPFPDRLRHALVCTEHDRNSPVWRWTAQQLAEQAIKTQSIKSLEVILSLEQAQLNARALWRLAAEALGVDAMARILARGQMVDPLAPLDVRSGQTAAHLAAKNGNLLALDWLFRHAGVSDKPNRQGQTVWDLVKESAAFMALTEDYRNRWTRRFEAFILTPIIQTGKAGEGSTGKKRAQTK